MSRLTLIVVCLLLAVSAAGAESYPSKGLKDVYFGEALYHAYQGEWFNSIARLDTELGQYRRLDEPGLDTLSHHINQAEFGVGDFELGYRMHLRAGRAITAVIEGNVADPVRNEAVYRLARLNFRKDQPENALQALERMRGEVPAAIRDNVEFLRGQILMANNRFPEAGRIFQDLQEARWLEGFAGYNRGIALIKEGKEQEGRESLDRAGQLKADAQDALAIKDKSNLVLGYKLLDENAGANAKLVLERVRLSGPFSNRALLGSGWADASQGLFDRALVPWSILAEREVTDPAVQEALLAVPFAYGKLNSYGQAAVRYGKALESFGTEVDKLGASITSVKEGKFLQALAREELKQDSDWVVKLRNLPQAPETYYLLELMASHDFQESLRNYLDLKELHKKLARWEGDLNAFEEIIQKRREYYQPLIPQIDQAFRELDSQIRLRMEQKDQVQKRLNAMLTAPRPDYLATAEERIALERIKGLEQALAVTVSGVYVQSKPFYLEDPKDGPKGEGGRRPDEGGATQLMPPFPPHPNPLPQGEGIMGSRNGGLVSDDTRDRISRLRGALAWNISTEYDQRLTDAYKHLADLNEEVDRMKKQYNAFVRTRQAATQSYEGYDEKIRDQRTLIASAQEKVKPLTLRQGSMLETMAVNELTKRRERLEQYRITARYAIADSYDRASRAQAEKSVGNQTEKSVVK